MGRIVIRSRTGRGADEQARLGVNKGYMWIVIAQHLM
jgi:hypothetical protein